MKLSEIFSQLSIGELSQVGIGGAKTGGIAAADYDKLVGHVNLGLTDLFTRFSVRQGRLVLTLQPGKATYILAKDFAVNNAQSTEPVRYIADTAEEPFLDDITKVERVLTDANHEMVLNVGDSPEAIITPSPTVLRLPKIMLGASVPDYLKTGQLEIFYRATHPTIVKDPVDFDPMLVEVDLPRTYLQALLYFVASRVHAPIGMGQEFYSGSIYATKYEQECARLASLGLDSRQSMLNTRLERNGWV